MKTLSKANKFFVLFAALSLVVSLVFPFKPAYTYADYNSSPICTISADNLNPVAGMITENITVTFNQGLTSTAPHTWALYTNTQDPIDNDDNNAAPVANTQVLNSTDFPAGLSAFGSQYFVSPTTSSESAVSGNTYHISASWDASNQENGNTWDLQFSTNDSTNDGCVMNTSGLGPQLTFQSLNVGPVNVASSPVSVNNPITASASFTDPNLANTHTAVWDWGDGSTSAGTVSESNGSGSVSDSHTYTTTGVYTVTLTVIDSGYNTADTNPNDQPYQHGVEESSQYQYVTVNNPLTLGTPSWTTNPMTTTQSTSVTVPVTGNLSGLAKGEYYVGTTDPGQGNGTAMTLIGGNLSTSFSNMAAGIYTVNFRAEDVAGNWSPVTTDYLVVYDPAKTSADGHSGDIEPIYGTDVLPGLIQTGQTDKEHFHFTVKYKNGQIDPASIVHFDYKTGTKCNNPNNAVNCHSTVLDATSIDWMVIAGTNNSQATIQGTATLTIDGTTSTNPFRVITTDGGLLNPTTTDQFEIEIYAPGANPNTAQPIYHMNDPLAKGSVVVKS